MGSTLSTSTSKTSFLTFPSLHPDHVNSCPLHLWPLPLDLTDTGSPQRTLLPLLPFPYSVNHKCQKKEHHSYIPMSFSCYYSYSSSTQVEHFPLLNFRPLDYTTVPFPHSNYHLPSPSPTFTSGPWSMSSPLITMGDHNVCGDDLSNNFLTFSMSWPPCNFSHTPFPPVTDKSWILSTAPNYTSRIETLVPSGFSTPLLSLLALSKPALWS